ncbi:hypothetical protein C8J56DRAFT_892885 [Mycena floridula]|nr:hypothetical protein C8J56DRAFT_892885 [Mycena floridula]
MSAAFFLIRLPHPQMRSAIENLPADVGQILAMLCRGEDDHSIDDETGADTVASASLTSKTMREIFRAQATKTAYIEQPKAGDLGGPEAFKNYIQSGRTRRVVISRMTVDQEWLDVFQQMPHLQELYLLETQLLDVAPHHSLSHLQLLAIVPCLWDLSLNPLSLIAHSPQLESVFWSMDGSTAANIDHRHELDNEVHRSYDEFKKHRLTSEPNSPGLSLTISVAEGRGEVVGEILVAVSRRLGTKILSAFRVLYQLAPSYGDVLVKSPFLTEYAWASTSLVERVTTLQMAVLEQPMSIGHVNLLGLRQVQSLTIQMRPESMPELMVTLASLPSSAELTELQLLLFQSEAEYGPLEQDQQTAWDALDHYCRTKASLKRVRIVWYGISFDDAFYYKESILDSRSATRYLGYKWIWHSLSGDCAAEVDPCDEGMPSTLC